MGEKSKLLGEFGENIIEHLFKNYLGYPHYRSNISIDCSYEKDHSLKKDKERKTHGIDGLISYNSPLMDKTLEIGLISSKFTKKGYSNTPRTKFRDFFKELAWTIQCFNHTDIKSDIESSSYNVENTAITGLLFWLTNSDESKDIIDEISKAEFGGDGLKFEKILFIDDARIDFLISVIKPIRDKYSEYDFVYPKTGFNNSPEFNESFGKKFPLDFFVYDLIPIRIIEETPLGGKGIYLYIACRKKFDPDELNRIIGLAKTFNHLEATSKTIISFPNYNYLDHNDIVKKQLSSFQDISFTSQIEVSNYNLDRRNFNHG